MLIINKKNNNKKSAYYIGAVAGFVNGFFGAGGGLVLVQLLKKITKDTNAAHASSIAIILPLCVISSFFYSAQSKVTAAFALPFIIGGLICVPAGVFLLKKTPSHILGRLFGAFMIFSAIRMLL